MHFKLLYKHESGFLFYLSSLKRFPFSRNKFFCSGKILQVPILMQHPVHDWEDNTWGSIPTKQGVEAGRYWEEPFLVSSFVRQPDGCLSLSVKAQHCQMISEPGWGYWGQSRHRFLADHVSPHRTYDPRLVSLVAQQRPPRAATHSLCTTGRLRLSQLRWWGDDSV